MDTNDRRPEGWTSADAAGLAIFPASSATTRPGIDAVPEIRHAIRVTVRASNGHVWPASHTAGSSNGALPMGARLRLKTNVDGHDPATRTSDPHARKIFRAMQRYGLIVADNGSDMYISGTSTPAGTTTSSTRRSRR
jgi:NaMN:DMB phosphoribosyltransferase